MNSFEFLAIRKLQKECGASDSQVAEFMKLVEVGSSLAPVEWAALDQELEQRADDLKQLAILYERDEERAELRRRHELADSFTF